MLNINTFDGRQLEREWIIYAASLATCPVLRIGISWRQDDVMMGMTVTLARRRIYTHSRFGERTVKGPLSLNSAHQLYNVTSSLLPYRLHRYEHLKVDL